MSQTYKPITEADVPAYITWLERCKSEIDGQKEDANQNSVFNSGNGDVQMAKDLVGNFLALISQKPVTIN